MVISVYTHMSPHDSEGILRVRRMFGISSTVRGIVIGPPRPVRNE